MRIGFLLDEHLPKWWRKVLVVRMPHLRVWRVGDPNAPPLRSPDPFLLQWCEQHNFYLLTNNRKTMPKHLQDHLASGRHVPGIFIVRETISVEDLAVDVEMIDGAALEHEFQDQVRFLPLTGAS